MSDRKDNAFPDAFHCGLTKREYFAAKAMQGLLANPNRDWNANDYVIDALWYADTLIETLEQDTD